MRTFLSDDEPPMYDGMMCPNSKFIVEPHKTHRPRSRFQTRIRTAAEMG
jgi:hypothetical protein